MESYSYKLFFASTSSQVPIWELDLNDIELLAGMLAVGMGIMDDINFDSPTSYYVDSDADVSSFRLLSDVQEDQLELYSINRLQQNQYGIWLKGSRRFVYSLYAFRTDKFFQGIVSMCNSFNVDFRNYIYGFPFDKDGNQYALANYVMAPNRMASDAVDFDDQEFEEQDDENIIEPLARTDDVYTFYGTDDIHGNF